MKNGLMMITAFLLQLVLAVECRAQSTAADNYPTQTIKIITNVSVGGTYDILARALADELQKTLGKPVVVEPRPGGNFLIAGRACAEAAADGHTVCALTGETMVYSGPAVQEAPLRSAQGSGAGLESDLQHATFVGQRHAWSKVPRGLARVAKQRPLAYMSPGIVQRNYLEQFNRRHGTDIVSVPFKGGGDAIASMLNGTTQIIFWVARTRPRISRTALWSALQWTVASARRWSPMYRRFTSRTDIDDAAQLARYLRTGRNAAPHHRAPLWRGCRHHDRAGFSTAQLDSTQARANRRHA